YLDAWPADGIIELPRPPLASVTSITYTDEDGATQTLAANNYRVDTAREPGRVVLAPGADWPSVALDSSNPITVRFVAGYADAGDVPGMAKAAILLQIGEIYANREAVIVGSTPQVTPAVQRVLNLLKVRY
ncbi:MAG: DNA-packaging protein, partial [Caldilineaceae bacterium]|nr:DNA-packaging protein [Caldilineaceae bacterium]